MSSGPLTPSAPLPALLNPIERRARAVEQARILRMAVTTAVVEGHRAYADANARVSVLEAEVDALLARRGLPGLRL
jgi:hypothetical protein